MPSFDRGFKSWTERTSLILRQELELAQDDPLDPAKLAEHLDVDLWTPYDVPGLPKDVLNQLLKEDPWGWSAVSIVSDGDSSSFITRGNPRDARPAISPMSWPTSFWITHPAR